MLILEIEGKETENKEDIINHVRKYWEEMGKIQEERTNIENYIKTTRKNNIQEQNYEITNREIENYLKKLNNMKLFQNYIPFYPLL